MRCQQHGACAPLPIWRELVQQFHVERFEIANVWCHHDGPVHDGRGYDERVFGQGVGLALHQPRPLTTNRRIHRQHLAAHNHSLKLILDSRRLFVILLVGDFLAAL